VAYRPRSVLRRGWRNNLQLIIDPPAVRTKTSATGNPAPPKADLSPEAWAANVRVSNLIKQIAPGDEVPEHVFDVIEAA
jgi:hypothetical protein